MKKINLFVFFLVIFPSVSDAGPLEISGNFSYSSSQYGGDNNYQWVRRYGASIGYEFLGTSEIELSLNDSVTRTKNDAVQDTTFHDRVYSVNWVQMFAHRGSVFQPFVKAGIGQLNREAEGSYAGGVNPPSLYDSLTGVLGAGFKVHIFRSFAFRMEGVTYLTGGLLSTWQDNVSLSGGLSFFM
jgi:hypothetical protein